MNKIRLVVVDDNLTFAQAVAASLGMAEDIEVLGIASNGREAVELVCASIPDVVLLDLVMPVMGGLEALQRIKFQTPSTVVIILTVCEDDTGLFKALQAGASGYLLKGLSLDDMAENVRYMAGGGKAIPPALVPPLIAEFQKISNRDASIRHLYSELTPTELVVLAHIAQGETRKQIADALFVADSTIKTHIKNIKNKLEVNSRTDMILVAREIGVDQYMSDLKERGARK